MPRQKLRVLLDLSLAVRGYCGISQDVRLLYKTLALSPEVEVTGLIYPMNAGVRRHRFCRAQAQRADRIANQSEFLWTLREGSLKWPNFRPFRILARLGQMGSRLVTAAAQQDRLETEKLWPTLWRMLFCQTLEAEDIPLVAQGNFTLSNVATDTMFWRVVLGRRPVKLDTSQYDFMIVQTARPMRISRGTQQIVRYHDMIPVLQPDTTPLPRDIRWNHKAICQSPQSFFVCNSDPTRESLYSVYPELRRRSATIPYMLSDAYQPVANFRRIRSILDIRRSAASGAMPRRPAKTIPRYIMGVSTLEPRKNFISLIQAFNAAKARERMRQTMPKLKLLIVGAPGWNCEPILAAMRPLIECGDLIHLEKVTTEEMRVLYTHAEAFVFPSHAEGFGFPPLEAMQCDTPAIVSDIPEHRWVLGDAALYCHSYDTGSIADAIERLLASDESPLLQQELVARGRERVKRYSLENCSAQWVELLKRLKREPVEASAGPANAQPRHIPIDRGLMDRAA